MPIDFFTCKNGGSLRYPVLLCAPHAGRDYPESLTSNSRISAVDLMRLEDRYVDLLLRRAEQAGFTTLTAQRARAWTDLNRGEDDIDRGMLYDVPDDAVFTISGKQRGGLGLIPRRLYPLGDIWKKPVSYHDVQDRIESYHRPYHGAVSHILQQMRAQFGGAILLDIHSMPPVTNFSGDRRPDFVVGDRFGSSAGSRFAEMLQAQLMADEFNCGLNHPYAGDYILRRHGAPQKNIHALQLETCRSLYLDGGLREPDGGLQKIQRVISGLARLMSDAIVDDGMLLAAE